MTHVAVRNGNLDGALRKFKQKVARDGIPSEFKKREAYDKPGVRRREIKAIAEAIPNIANIQDDADPPLIFFISLTFNSCI